MSEQHVNILPLAKYLCEMPTQAQWYHPLHWSHCIQSMSFWLWSWLDVWQKPTLPNKQMSFNSSRASSSPLHLCADVASDRAADIATCIITMIFCDCQQKLHDIPVVCQNSCLIPNHNAACLPGYIPFI